MAKVSDQDVVITTFNKLTNLETLAVGGYGTVYKANHSVFGTVAYKKLQVSFIRESIGCSLINEAKLHSSLNHPNIVKVYGLVFEPNHYGLVLELMDNGEMIDFFQEHRIDWTQKLHMVHDVASAMAYLHGQIPPIIHGDLKAQNVLISENNEAKVCDFGFSVWKELSKTHSQITESPRGTVTNIPPEHWIQPRRKTEMFDVYSFAILVWEAMTETRPFAEESNSQAIRAHVVNGCRPDLKLVPPDVSETAIIELMKSCWSQNAIDRPKFTEIVSGLKKEIDKNNQSSQTPTKIVSGLKKEIDKNNQSSQTPTSSSELIQLFVKFSERLRPVVVPKNCTINYLLQKVCYDWMPESITPQNLNLIFQGQIIHHGLTDGSGLSMPIQSLGLSHGSLMDAFVTLPGGF